MSPRVSIVTLSYNQGQFLDRAIRSVINQDYPNLEYIVVDPGSTDNSRAIIDHYGERIGVRVLEPDDGPGDGLNKGFARATGSVFAYLNADDALLPNALNEAVVALHDAPQADVVTGHGYIVDAAGKVLRRFRSARFDAVRHVFGAAIVMQQSTFFTAAAFRATGGFNPSNRTCWDAEILLDMAAAGARFKRVDRFWSLFTMHDAGITGSGRLAEQTRRDEDALFEKDDGPAAHRPRSAHRSVHAPHPLAG